MSGRFVTFEGLDGAGKTTQVRAVAEALDDLGIDVEMTREPGGTRLGERLRGLLLGDEPLIPEVELLLLFAARADHVETRIRPALERGAWVLCDRFTDASYAYQGGGRGIPAERISVLESWVQGELRPDLTIFLDLPVETSLARISGGLFQETRDRFEREHLEFFERVREAYLARCGRCPDRYRRIDGALDIPDVTRAILEALHPENGPGPRPKAAAGRPGRSRA